MRRLYYFWIVAACLLAQDNGPAIKLDLPLKPDRKIEFTVDEGSWLSVSVSPDGKTIVFDLLGDLYTLPLAGGEAERITSGLPFDSQPIFSPDGKHIAFTSDRDGGENLWIANADGSQPKQLTTDKQADFVSPSWTADGEYVLVSRNPQGLGVHEIWMYNIHGGTGVQVTKSMPAGSTPNLPQAQRLNFLGAVASSDGRYFYYARRTGAFTYNATFPLWQIVRRDRTTGDEDVITSSAGSAFRPILSPDGNQLVYGTRLDAQTGLRIRDLSTGEDRWLKFPVQRDDQESRATRDVLPGYAFTPDGKEVVVSYGGKIQRVQVGTGESTVVPFQAHVSLDLGPELKFESRIDQGPVHARLIQGPVQSPDRKRLVLSSLTHLYSLDLPTGKALRLTSGDSREYQPAWSPDGQYVAYVTWSAEGGHIWRLRADGQSRPERLTSIPGYYQDPAWTPDGSRIVALRGSTRDREEAQTGFGPQTGLDVVWIPAVGGRPQLIVPARGVGKPHFTHDSDRVYVYSPQGLQSIRFDGTDRRTHLKVVGKNLTGTPEPPAARDVRISPKGTQALALVNDQLYLLDVPVTGGDAPTVNVSSPSVPLKKLTDVGADSFAWADDGQTITWSLGSSYFRQPVSTVTFDAPARASGNEEPKTAESRPPDKGPKRYEEFSVEIEVPRHKPSGTVVLRGAKVITMHGDEVIADADIIVTDNRIAAVGKRGSVAAPAGAKIIDLKGAIIMPGIVDVHAHWTEIKRGVLDMQSWPFLANLAYGVTTGRDPQTGTNDMFAYQDLIDTGDVLGPRAFSTGPGIFSSNDFQSYEDTLAVVTRYKKYYRTNTVKSYTVGNRKQREWVVQAAKENQIMPTTEGALDLKLDLTHAIDGFSGNEHALPIVPLYADVINTFVKSGITYTPTLLVAYGGPWAENYFYETTEVHDDNKMRRFFPHEVLDLKSQRRPWFRNEEQVFPLLAASAAKIVRAGGRVCIGGHGQIQGIQCHWEMWALKTGGLTNFEVLRAATIHGAEALGFAKDIGSIEPGKLADLIVLNKDPLVDIRNTNTIRYVMKDGELFEGDTLNQIWPQQKPLPELWWSKTRP